MSSEKTYRQIVHSWRHWPGDKSGFVSDDFSMSDEAILCHLLDTRAEVLRNLQTLGIGLGTQNIQTIPCIELEKTDKSECPCAPPTGCIWLKSKKPIPRYIKLSSVSDIIGAENISFIEWNKVKYKFKSRAKGNKNKKYYTIRDIGEGSYLYILNDSFLKMVSLSAVFEDPKCAREFGGCGVDSVEIECNPWDTPFILDAGLRNQVLKSAWQTLPAVRRVAEDDRNSNSLQDTPGLDNNTI